MGLECKLAAISQIRASDACCVIGRYLAKKRRFRFFTLQWDDGRRFKFKQCKIVVVSNSCCDTQFLRVRGLIGAQVLQVGKMSLFKSRRI